MFELVNESVKFRNFLSYGNNWTEISFHNGVATFIAGENHDDNSNNGCGKSSILNAICYAIYNKPFDSISLPKLINYSNAAKNTLMEVVFNFKKGNDSYEIQRRRGESTGVVLLKNGVDITPDSVNETDSLIESIYGFSYEMFTRCIVWAGSSVPFLDLPVSQQRNHVEELFNISILSEKALKLKKVIQTTESDIKVEEAILREKETTVKLQEKRITDMEAKVVYWEEQNEKQKTDIRNKLSQVQGIDFEAEQELFTTKSQLEKEKTKNDNEIASITRAISRINAELSTRKKEYEHLVVNNCPYCLQQMPNAADKIKEIEKDINDIEAILIEHNHQLTVCNNLKENISLMLEEVKSKIKYDNLPSLIETKSNSAVLEATLKQLEESENPYFETYEQLLSEGITQPSYEKLDELKSTIEHENFLLKLLTDKNSFIRRKIISRTIPFLNLQLNTYASMLGLPHVVQFKDDMSCVVSQFGRELDFGNLSSGQKKRVNLAMSLAFRDVLHHLHSKVNLLFVDEIDASLCPLGVENVIKLLKQKTKDDNLSTWVVMHRQEARNKFDKDLIVHLRSGFSELEYVDNL